MLDNSLDCLGAPLFLIFEYAVASTMRAYMSTGHDYRLHVQLYIYKAVLAVYKCSDYITDHIIEL